MASFHEHDADMTPSSLQDPDEKKQKNEDHGHGHSHDHADGHKSEVVALGTLTLGGATFAIDREGQIESGKATTFGVECISGTAVPTEGWLANPDGEKLHDPVKGDGHDQHWHFTVEPLMPVKKSKFVLKVGMEEAGLDFARGAAPCNDGILAVFKGVGFLELKLHDDAGDLELWLYKSAGTATSWLASTGKPVPFDLPKETVISVTFPSHEGKTIEMRIRNDGKNEDEDGTPNMRGGGTNYFIFPGETGADPEWLTGDKWRGVVTVAFEVDGKSYACEPFVLVPHSVL